MQTPEIAISCLGFSQTLFSIHRPDRLCRGREHWIYQPEDTPEEVIFRTVISGTTIKDSRIRYLDRGLRCSGKSLAEITSILFAKKTMIGWVEEGDARNIPPEACGVETYQISHPFGPVHKWGARYEVDIQSKKLDEYVEKGMEVWVIDPIERDSTEVVRDISPIPPLYGEAIRPPLLSEKLRDALFLLTGHRNAQNTIALFQPIAISEVLKYCSAVVLVHKDKHDICLGIYTQEKEFAMPVQALAKKLDVVMVPFAIPPMLARWDRALRDLQKEEGLAQLQFLNPAEDSSSEDSESSSEDD